MKSLLFFAAAFAATLSVSAQPSHPNSPHDTVETKDIKVTYGRPYKKDRVIFGGLEKYGKVWRTGADEATAITFKKDGKFGDQKVKAGTYTLFTIPNENEWTIILNSQLGQWGAFSYEKNKDKDVLKFNVPVKKLDQPVEQNTIRLIKDKSMIIEWDQTQVVIPIDF